MNNKKDIFINYTKNSSWVLIDDEIFVFDEIINKLYVYRKLAKDIWLLIGKEHNISNIIFQLKDKNQYNDDMMEMKVFHYIEKFKNNNLIEWGKS